VIVAEARYQADEACALVPRTSLGDGDYDLGLDRRGCKVFETIRQGKAIFLPQLEKHTSCVLNIVQCVADAVAFREAALDGVADGEKATVF